MEYNHLAVMELLLLTNQIEHDIVTSAEYLYFEFNSTPLIRCYKHFEVKLLGVAMACIIKGLDIDDSTTKNFLKTVYLDKVSDFKKILLSKEVRVDGLEIAKKEPHIQEILLNIRISIKFVNYYKELKEFLRSDSIYYTEEGNENRLYTFLWNMLLCYEGADFYSVIMKMSL